MELTKFAVLAHAAHHDENDALSITGIFDHVWTERGPDGQVRLRAFVLVVRLEAHANEGDQHQFEATLIDPDGTPHDGFGEQIHFKELVTGQPMQSEVIVEYEPFTVPDFGEYELHIRVDGVRLAELPLRLVELAPES